METKDILKQLRIDAGLTQKQISENSGVSYSAYQKYESGERELGANSLKKLADYYRKTTDYLLGREERQEPYYHAKLEDNIKKAYLSLPREVRASILQAMVDAVLSYQQEESNTTIEQSSSESTQVTEQPADEAQQAETATQGKSTQQTMQDQDSPEEEQPQKSMPTIQQEESEVRIRHNAIMRKDIKKKASRNGEKPFVRVLTEEQKDEIRSRPRADEDM